MDVIFVSDVFLNFFIAYVDDDLQAWLLSSHLPSVSAPPSALLPPARPSRPGGPSQWARTLKEAPPH